MNPSREGVMAIADLMMEREGEESEGERELLPQWRAREKYSKPMIELIVLLR